MLETPKALSTHLNFNNSYYYWIVKNLKDITMDNQQETKVIYKKNYKQDPQRLYAIISNNLMKYDIVQPLLKDNG